MRVLVVYKKSTWQRYQADRDPHLTALIDAGDASVERMRSAHDAHLDTIDRARRLLKRLKIKAAFRHKHERIDEPVDLVITLGGDGTLLWASHTVGARTPMLAINSDPDTSVGYFCAGHRFNCEEIIERALEKQLSRLKLARMSVHVNGECASSRILNDVLFCHECPAATTRFNLSVHRESAEETESQTCSGIWVGPAAGSTAAQRSAGGKVLALGSRKIQFVVREPYLPHGGKLRLNKGLITPGESLALKTKIREGRLYFDGAHRVARVDIGAELIFRLSDEPLTILGLSNRR